MATQKKIVITLTGVEAAHLAHILDAAQAKHEQDMGHANPALVRIQKKIQGGREPEAE